MIRNVFPILILQGFLLSSSGEDKLILETKQGYSELTAPLFYRDIGSVLKFLDDPQYKTITGVQELVNIYKHHKKKNELYNNTNKVKGQPLFVLEGLAGSGKTTIGHLLAKKIDGVQIHSPPSSTEYLKPLFQVSGYLMESAYNALSHYIAALEVLILLQTSPVIMDRYWHSSATYWIAHAIQADPRKYEMPLSGSRIYTWPEDLLKPDIVFMLDVSEDLRTHRIFNRTVKNVTKAEILLSTRTEFRKNILLAYKNMYNPAVTVVYNNATIAEAVEDIFSRIKHLLKV